MRKLLSRRGMGSAAMGAAVKDPWHSACGWQTFGQSLIEVFVLPCHPTFLDVILTRTGGMYY